MAFAVVVLMPEQLFFAATADKDINLFPNCRGLTAVELENTLFAVCGRGVQGRGVCCVRRHLCRCLRVSRAAAPHLCAACGTGMKIPVFRYCLRQACNLPGRRLQALSVRVRIAPACRGRRNGRKPSMLSVACNAARRVSALRAAGFRSMRCCQKCGELLIKRAIMFGY